MKGRRVVWVPAEVEAGGSQERSQGPMRLGQAAGKAYNWNGYSRQQELETRVR